MKIIHIIVGLEPDGAETMLKRLIESEPKAIPDTVVVSLTTLGVIGGMLRGIGVKVYHLNLSRWGYNFPIVFYRLIAIIRRFGPDIVQTWMYHADLIGGVGAYLAGHRNIIWGIRVADIHSSSILTSGIRRLCALMSTLIPRKIVCVAEAAKLSHMQIGYDGGRMVVIQNGLRFSDLEASVENRELLRRRCGFSTDSIVVGCLGRFDPIKDHRNFILAAEIVSKRFESVYFLMVGRDLDRANDQLCSWILQTSCSTRFILLGERADVATCLSAMDVFCLSSCVEGFPNALSEAMAVGLPCVSTDVGDAALLLGDTGIVVPPKNSELLAAAVMNVIELSNGQRSKMGARAKERVITEFSIQKARSRFEKTYRDVLEGR